MATHTRLLKAARGLINKLAEDFRVRDAAAATLCHADLHKRNIFVSDDDPSVITSIIDWQSSSIEPAFEYADYVPDFAASLPDTSTEGEPAKAQAELCKQAFDACMHVIPKLFAARAIDDDLIRPFQYCYRTWRDGAVVLRQKMVETSRRWAELGLTGSCPYVMPTSNELMEHQREYQRFRVAHDLKRKLVDLLDTTPDGWVPPDLWEATQMWHQEAFRVILQETLSGEHVEDDPMNEEDLKKIWPFDISSTKFRFSGAIPGTR